MAAPARTASRRAGALARAFAASSRRGDAVALADARRAFGALARPARPVASTLAPSQSTSSSRLSIRGFAADAEPAGGVFPDSAANPRPRSPARTPTTTAWWTSTARSSPT